MQLLVASIIGVVRIVVVAFYPQEGILHCDEDQFLGVSAQNNNRIVHKQTILQVVVTSTNDLYLFLVCCKVVELLLEDVVVGKYKWQAEGAIVGK